MSVESTTDHRRRGRLVRAVRIYDRAVRLALAGLAAASVVLLFGRIVEVTAP